MYTNNPICMQHVLYNNYTAKQIYSDRSCYIIYFDKDKFPFGEKKKVRQNDLTEDEFKIFQDEINSKLDKIKNKSKI